MLGSVDWQLQQCPTTWQCESNPRGREQSPPTNYRVVQAQAEGSRLTSTLYATVFWAVAESQASATSSPGSIFFVGLGLGFSRNLAVDKFKKLNFETFDNFGHLETYRSVNFGTLQSEVDLFLLLHPYTTPTPPLPLPYPYPSPCPHPTPAPIPAPPPAPTPIPLPLTPTLTTTTTTTDTNTHTNTSRV